MTDFDLASLDPAIRAALLRTEGRIEQAAIVLGMTPATLAVLLAAAGMGRPVPEDTVAEPVSTPAPTAPPADTWVAPQPPPPPAGYRPLHPNDRFWRPLPGNEGRLTHLSTVEPKLGQRVRDEYKAMEERQRREAHWVDPR